MHVDFFNITVPDSDSHIVEKSLLPILSELHIVKITDGLYSPGSRGGTLKISKYLRVVQYSFSGSVLRLLRESGLFNTVLSVFSEVPHNVTVIHIAHDVSDSDCPSVLGRLYNRAVRGGVSFTRKSVDPSHVTRVLSPSSYGGRDTGTVYIGSRKHNVSLSVYDKRHEVFCRTGSDLGYNLLRYELRCGRKLGVSLRDVSSPDSLFWFHMSDVLKPPRNVPAWVSSSAGYSLPSRAPMLPYEALKRSLASSPVISDWVRLASQLGDRGIPTLLSLIEREVLSRVTPQGNSLDDTLAEG